LTHLVDSIEFGLCITVKNFTEKFTAIFKIFLSAMQAPHQQQLRQLSVVFVSQNRFPDMEIIVAKKLIPRKTYAEVLQVRAKNNENEKLPSPHRPNTVSWIASFASTNK
jgi:hypothetical protein